MTDVRAMVQVEQSPDRSLRGAEPSGQGNVTDSSLAHCTVESELGRIGQLQYSTPLARKVH